ncbi:MAG: V-type ATP synthase subunit I [Candidatus Brocadia sp.]
MAIEKVNKVSILLPENDSERFLSQLYYLNIVHLIDTFTQLDNLIIPSFKRFPTTFNDIEKNIQKLNAIFSTLKTFAPKKKSFVEGIFPIPLQITRKELDQALSRIDLESLFEECRSRYEKYVSLQKRQKQLKEELDKLTDFLPLSFEFSQIRSIKNVSFFYCQASESRWNRFLRDAAASEFFIWQIVSKSNEKLKILLAYLNKDKDDALRILAKFSFKEIPFPVLSGNIKDRRDELALEMSHVIQEQERIRHRILELSGEWRSLEILMGYWENERNKVLTQHRCVISKRVFVLIGYVKIKDKPKLDTLLQCKFPQASVVYEEPSPVDTVPVSITLNRFFKPAQLLINMFGLPNYFTFDPTPFVMISFLIFFGLCFGDVFYGAFLTAFSAWMARKYKASEGFSNFLKLFLYAGISTIIFGAVTGGWAGDLYNPMYLGENNLLLKIKERLTLLDPLSKPVMALLFAIGLGVLNQFYGITLRMYGELKKKNILNAICDGLLWLIMLPGFLILISTIFMKIPSHIVNVGKYMTIIGAVGLISTQGRNERSIVGKIFTGIVSLYGIVGTYGCTSFIGDILSYTRVLALSLTTTIVGMAFNIVATLFKTGTLIGTIFFIITLIFGHMFNFVMSILGAFIHPARLIFLEFFGRFYEGGAPKFQPYGLGNQRINIIENE